ncbi:MAG: prepilin-type N-terminal cleavage/methylation domain-containing protein [Planctomycetes bacterium]|nr:prepilin-type N-terminal cleavage/methylation domain-containing protein [Planctomycetota bacterium]
MLLRPHGPIQSKAHGFTLIEISVVIVIFALMFTTVTVSLDGYLPSSRSESGARELLSTIDLARTSAVAHGRSYDLQMDLDENRYRILTPYDAKGSLARNPEDRASLNWTSLPTGVYFSGVLDASGAARNQGTVNLSFASVGSAEETWIQLGNEAGEGYALTARVLALTGHSKVFKGFQGPSIVTEDEF